MPYHFNPAKVRVEHCRAIPCSVDGEHHTSAGALEEILAESIFERVMAGEVLTMRWKNFFASVAAAPEALEWMLAHGTYRTWTLQLARSNHWSVERARIVVCSRLYEDRETYIQTLYHHVEAKRLLQIFSTNELWELSRPAYPVKTFKLFTFNNLQSASIALETLNSLALLDDRTRAGEEYDSIVHRFGWTAVDWPNFIDILVRQSEVAGILGRPFYLRRDLEWAMEDLFGMPPGATEAALIARGV